MRTTIAITLVLFIAAAMLLSGCATPNEGSLSIGWEEPKVPDEASRPKVSKKTGPPSHAPAHGYRAKHTYRYYPNEQTYYDTERRLYFYLEMDGWTFGASLPDHIKLSNDYVSFHLDTDRPYEYFDEHVETYPPKKLKKKEKKKWAKNTMSA